MARPANKPKISWSYATGSNHGLKPNDPIWNDEKALKARIADATWTPKAADWRDIEKAYRRAIPVTLREAIIEAADRLAWSMRFEANAAAIDKTTTKEAGKTRPAKEKDAARYEAQASIISFLEGIEQAALAFAGAFNAAGGRGAKREALQLLNAHLKESGWGNTATRAARDDMGAFAREVRACLDAVKNDASKRQDRLRQDSPGPFDHHAGLNRFLASLIKAFGDEDAKAKEAGRRHKSERFPTTVNKAGRDSVSDFPRCVAEILKKAKIEVFPEQTAYALGNHIDRVRARVIKRP